MASIVYAFSFANDIPFLFREHVPWLQRYRCPAVLKIPFCREVELHILSFGVNAKQYCNALKRSSWIMRQVSNSFWDPDSGPFLSDRSFWGSIMSCSL